MAEHTRVHQSARDAARSCEDSSEDKSGAGRKRRGGPRVTRLGTGRQVRRRPRKQVLDEDPAVIVAGEDRGLPQRMESTLAYARAYQRAERRLSELDRGKLEHVVEFCRVHAGNYRAPIAVRRSFVRIDCHPLRSRDENESAAARGLTSPLLELLRRGRGGEVPLKLYLAVLARALRYPYRLEPTKADWWARMLGLHDPKNAGRQRVGNALTALIDARLLALPERRERGLIQQLEPLHESGDGWPYWRPNSDQSERAREAKRAGQEMLPKADERQRASAVDAHLEEDLYLRLEREVLANGWLSVLSGTAVACLLILLQEAGYSEKVRKEKVPGSDFEKVVGYEPVWLAPSRRRDRYGLSDEAFTSGTFELAAWGLVNAERTTEHDPLTRHQTRPRYHFTLRADRIRKTPSLGGLEPEST